MSSAQFARYTGSRVLPFPAPGGAYGPGACKSCGCDPCDCQCGRHCRKEAKELLFTADATQQPNPVRGLAEVYQAALGTGAAAAEAGTPTLVSAFIGGGCCVHVSVEYAPIAATAQTVVALLARGPDGTLLLWEKTDPAGASYQVKENVLTTKPGATLYLYAVNATARARWCEVFSC